jgi:uncharacterized membrane protein
MRSKLSIKGHPIHPAIVALPIGLYFGTVLSDIAFHLSPHDSLWLNVSFWAGVAAIVTALIAAVFGFGDYLTMPQSEKVHKIATTHMIANLATVALFAVAAFLLKGEQGLTADHMGLVTALHVIGIGTTLFAGWLGGTMVYHHHLGVLNEDERRDVAGEAQSHTRHARG